jgi:hypothetical protein
VSRHGLCIRVKTHKTENLLRLDIASSQHGSKSESRISRLRFMSLDPSFCNAVARSAMDANMDAKYCRQKAELCLRLADGFSLNNPARFQLMDLAEDFPKRAKKLEAEEAERQKSKAHKTD